MAPRERTPLDTAPFVKIGFALVQVLVAIVMVQPTVCFPHSAMPLFDGKTFTGWEGDTNHTWRLEGGAIVAGVPDRAAPRNEFLATTRDFANFELRVKFKIEGTEGLSPEQLIESLLWPNRQIREGYLATTIITRDGEQFTGYKVRETPDEWQLRDPAANQIHRIAKANVQSVKDIGSLMPEGLTAGMTRDELHDLLRFLIEQGRQPSPH